MAGGYDLRPDGVDGAARILNGLQRQIDALRSGAGIRSSILRNAQLEFQDEDGNTSGIFGRRTAGRLSADGVTSTEPAHGSAFFDPTNGRLLFIAHKYEVTGDTLVQAGTAGAWADLTLFRVFADDVGINGNDVDINSTTTLSLTGPDIVIDASDKVVIDGDSGGVQINSGGNLKIFELSTTSSSASLRLDPGSAEILWVNSSRRYKTDIADAEIDLEDVLALKGRTWADKAAIEREEPGDLRRDVGFIAEELDELPSMRQFVDYNEAGEPESIQYDRLSVALLALAKDQQERLDSIEERLTNLESGAK